MRVFWISGGICFVLDIHGFHCSISCHGFEFGGNAQGCKISSFHLRLPSFRMHYKKKISPKDSFIPTTEKSTKTDRFNFQNQKEEMVCFRTAIISLAALLFSSECVLSRPVKKRQAIQFKYALLSQNSGKFVTVLNNGSVFATGFRVQGKHESSSLWCLHSNTHGYKLENVQNRDHYLAVAHRDNVTILVAHNLSKPFTLQMMMEQERILSGDGQSQNITQHNENNSSGNSGSTFSFHSEWTYNFVTHKMKLVRDDAGGYLSFDQFGYPLDNLCSNSSMRNNLDTSIIYDSM